MKRFLLALALAALVALVIIMLSTIIVPANRAGPGLHASTPTATFDPNVTPTITPTAPDTPTTFEQTPTIIPFKTQTPP